MGTSQTRLLLSLQWRLWKRTLSGNPAIAVTAFIAGLYAFIGLVAGVALTVQGMMHGPVAVVAAVVGAGVIGYLLLALFLPSGEGQLRPGSFVTLPLTARQLLPASAIATLMQTRGVIAAIASAVTTVAASVAAVAGGQAWLVAVIVPMMLLGLVTALLLGEFLAVVVGGSGRASQERTGVFGAIVFLVVVIGYSVLTSSGIGLAEIELVGRILAWTPFGAAGGVVAAAAASQWLTALAQLAVALASVLVVLWWWRRRLERELRAPLQTGSSSRTGDARDARPRELLLPGVGYTPAGVVVSRAMRYLRRDSRLLPSVIMVPLLGVFALVQGLLGQPEFVYFGVAIMALLSGSLASNDFGYDGPPGWLHLVTGIPARTHLLARHLGSALPGVFFVIVYLIATLFLVSDRVATGLAAVAAVGLLATSLAIGLTLTTINPYPTSIPGTNPWSDKSGFSGAAFIAAFAAIFLGWIPSAPGVVLMIIGYGGSVGVTAAGAALAVLLPAVVYAAAIVLCCRYVARNRVKIYDKVRNWVT